MRVTGHCLGCAGLDSGKLTTPWLLTLRPCSSTHKSTFAGISTEVTAGICTERSAVLLSLEEYVEEMSCFSTDEVSSILACLRRLLSCIWSKGSRKWRLCSKTRCCCADGMSSARGRPDKIQRPWADHVQAMLQRQECTKGAFREKPEVMQRRQQIARSLFSDDKIDRTVNQKLTNLHGGAYAML